MGLGLLQKGFNISFIGLLAFPILPLNIAAIFLILSLSTVVLEMLLFKHKPLKQPIQIPLILLGSIALLYLLYLPIATDFHSAWFEFEKRAGLLVIPFLFLLTPKDWLSNIIEKAKWSFILATTGLSLLWIILHFTGLADIYITDDDTPYFFKLRTTFERYTQVHPTYFGLFAGTSILLLLDKLSLHHKLNRDLLYYLLIGLTTVGLFLSGARVAIVATMLAAMLSLILQKKYRLLATLILFTGGAAIAGKDVFFPRLKNAASLFSQEQTASAKGSSIRKEIATCSFELLKENWAVGLGSDAVQPALNFCYSMLNSHEAIMKSLNTHNEALNLMLTFGVIGLAVLILYFISLFRLGYSNPLVLAFTIMLGLQFLTENVLARQHGVFFTALFTAILLVEQPKKNKLNGLL